jgi:hypothetical protein
MNANFEALAHDALVLPAEQRVALAYRLLESVEPVTESNTETAWDTEIAERIARFDSGETKPVNAIDFFARLRQIAPRR